MNTTKIIPVAISGAIVIGSMLPHYNNECKEGAKACQHLHVEPITATPSMSLYGLYGLSGEGQRVF